MNRGIQAVATSMVNSEQWLDTVANNLANASTTGFKRDGMTFQATLQQVSANGGAGASVGSISNGTVIATPYSTLGELGPMTPTGNPLDVAIKTPGAMFAVKDSTGQISYTRDGSFTLDSDRNLVTQSGLKVLDDNNNAIQLPAGQISISSTGTVVVTAAGTPTTLGKLGAYTGNFLKAGNNLYSDPTGAGATPVANPEFASGTLEGSNVNPVEAMLDLIKIGRSYELQQKSITQEDQLTQKLVSTIG
ncbi:MAG: flagellar hook-basal body protein [Fimbriimonadaceae bacterium]